MGDLQLVSKYGEENGGNNTDERHQKMLAAIDALERAETLTEFKAIHDQAAGWEEMFRLRKDSWGLQQAAAAVRIRAEHKVGTALTKIERFPGRRTDNLGVETPYQKVLREEGVSDDQSQQWQKLSCIPHDLLVNYLGRMIASQREITTADVLHLLDEPDRPTPRGKKEVFPGKYLRVLLLDSTEMEMEEQESLIWAAIKRAYLLTKKEEMTDNLRISKQVPGYWLALICAEYVAHNGEG